MDDKADEGQRLARRLVDRLDDHDGLALHDVDGEDAESDPTADGTLAATVTRPEDGGDLVAEIYVQADRARVEFVAAPDVAADAATAAAAGLRVRPKAVRPPRTLVFVEDEAQIDPAASVVETVRDALERDGS